MTDVQLGQPCGLYIDLSPFEAAPMPGDWLATEAGSRYLVQTVAKVASKRHAQRDRYRMRVVRLLPKGAEPPADVRCIWLQWYHRGRR